jgi:hypothetical protein
MAEPAHQHEPDPDATEAPSGSAPHVCTVALCPICLAVTAMQPLAPEVIEHLLKAGTELLLAVKAVVESRTDQVRPEADEGRRLERIDIA